MNKRPWARPVPLALQLTAAFALLVALAFGGGGLFLTHWLQGRQMAMRTNEVLAKARTLAVLVNQVQDASGAELNQLLFSYQQQMGVRPVVLDSDGTVIGDSWVPSPFVGRTLAIPEAAAALDGREAAGPRRIEPDGLVLYAAVPRTLGDQPAGAILVSASLADMDQVFRDLNRQTMWVILAGGLLALLFGWGLARALAAPLERLSAATTALAHGDMGVRVDPGGSLETAALGYRFNEMAEELAHVEEQRRRFIGAASHELRTPVAAIRALGDAVLSDDTADVALYREYVGDILKECDHAAHLVDRMLALTRLEGRTRRQPDENGRLELAEAAAATVVGLRPLAQSRSIALTLDAGEPVWVPGESWLVKTVLINLVENAIKFTPPGGSVQVLVYAQGEEARIVVRDTGPGIAPEHLPHLFERFYRADQSRARTTGGVGLGLSIAAEAAAQLNGRIEVESQVGAGSQFTLVLPVAKSLADD